ncbi:chromatin modification-related protein EAF1 B-like isoform X2 [Olea europaea var. sylvestris]|uniref:chromatin modification-related protein EAF1 B-like isoform X2 n=1 Tax=Olea europaea var. sylvestris TaxID=158386 RepID=UPI000C1D7A23|nr:chromatin modification-related protein EAF1 B-like isoform X2 [Olea europaea var. sylvestris]
MHGCSSAFVTLVNAEVDSMGLVGIGSKTSPLRAEIEKVQSELRQEYIVRDERRRELEYLEKGGNPLDFKLGNVASVSVQSTSLRNRHPDQFVTSERKGSFTLISSPHGDSVESSGRPGAPPREPNSADNIMLFDGKIEFSEGDQNSSHPSRSNIAPSEKSSYTGGSQNVREFGESDAFGLPRKAYKRRYRSRPSNDRIKSSSTDVVLTRGGHGSSLPPLRGPRDAKELVSDSENYNNQNTSSNCNSKPTSPMDNILHMTVPSVSQQDMELDSARIVKSTKDSIKDGSPNAASDSNTSKTPLDNQNNQQSISEAEKSPVKMASDGPEPLQSREEVTSGVIECQPSVIPAKVESQSCSCHMNGLGSEKGNQIKNDAQNSSTERGTKGLDSESSCTQTMLSINGNNEGEMCTNMRNVDSNGSTNNQVSVIDGIPNAEGDELFRDKKENKANDNSTTVIVGSNSTCQSLQENGILLKGQEEINGNAPTLQNEVKAQVIIEGMEAGCHTGSESERESVVLSHDNPDPTSIRHQDSINSSISKLPKASLAGVSTVASVAQNFSVSNLKLASKVAEDSILEEARIIEAKQKRIMELSTATSPLEIRRKSHWDYVLEEMAWLAYDFAQERLWKINAAAQICHRVAFTSQSRKQVKASPMKEKKVAYTMAKAVMEFWHSVEEKSKELELQSPKEGVLAVQSYALKFLKYNNSDAVPCHAEALVTPERIPDSGILDMSWEDHLTEENLFYTVQPEAMESYRKSIESLVDQYEKTGSTVQDEVDTSACDDIADNAYEEDEGETSTYDTAVAFDGLPSRFAQKNPKHLTNPYGARSYKIGPHFLPMQCIESKVATQQSALLAKRPGSTLNVSIPTKRMRTASRRVISPFSAGTSGGIQISNKTDASSGDTDSYQDDQSTSRGGSLVPNGLEVESVGEFEKQLPFESVQILTKPKKKKKEKHLNATYEQRWQVDSNFQSEQFQWDHLKKRSESHQLESNGSSGLSGQHIMKKQKIMRQSQDNSFETIAPIGGSVPSPAASQIGNVPQPNKFVRILGGRDRGKKPKILKMPAGQLGSGSLWSLFEDQALVVLVHDLGPNWELVSDAINSTLQLKCIFRKPKECKERHNILMDRTSGDGEDSIEYSGSSQPYPSTLPGIPKGSARQLFQRLQAPMEEDTIKSHFEKIIMIGAKQNYRKPQSQKREQAHDSHAIALSQVCPTNPNGGPILTPLDLCDATTSSPEIHSIGYQVPLSSGLAIAKQATVAPMLPTSVAGSAVQGSSNIMAGNNISMPPDPLNSSVRDGRYGVPRSTSLSIDEQQRMQQYNQIISGRNIQQPSMSAPGAFPGTDRSVRMLTGSSGMGMVSGVNRSMPIVRPGFKVLSSTSMVNSGSMVSPGAVSVNIQSAVVSGQGNSVFRPRDNLHMMRSGPSLDSQRQMMVSDLQMQAPPGSSQGISPFGGKNSPFPNQTASRPVSSVHQQQSHPVSPQQPQVRSSLQSHLQGAANQPPNAQQQAYAMRLPKERQIQHRILQQQFTASNSLMQHVPPQPQLPISSPSQNSSQVQSQTISPSVSHSPLTSASINTVLQHQQKHQMHSSQTISSVNQTGKQWQRQQQQQQVLHGNRPHSQQQQQTQSQRQAKLSKGIGRGNMMHQSIPVGPSLLDGISSTGNQSSETGVLSTHLIQGQGSYPGPPLNAVQLARQNVPSQSSNQSLPQHKAYSGQVFSPSKHPPQMPSHPDNSSEALVLPVTSASTSSAGHQSVPAVTMAASNHQWAPPHQKLVNQNPESLQRGFHQNRKPNSDPSNKPQARDCHTEQLPTSSSAEIGPMTTLPQVCNNATNVAQVISPPSVHRNGSEPLFDSDTSNSPTNLGSLVPPPASSNESVPQNIQGPGQRLLSMSLPKIGHDVSAQWQQQPSQLQPPPSPVAQPQQQQQQQQPQLLQAGNGSLYGRPGEPKLE